MTVAIDTDDVSSVLGHGRNQIHEVREAADRAVSSATDPRVKSALEALLGRTKADLDKTDGTAAVGEKTSEAFADNDDCSAHSVAAVTQSNAPVSSTPASAAPASPAPVARPMLSAAQLAGPTPQMPSMQGSPMMSMAPSAPMASSMVTPLSMAASTLAPTMVAAAAPPAQQYPPGSVTMTRSQLAALIEAQGGAASGESVVDAERKSTWDGDTKPAPINVDDVEYTKGKGKLSDAEISAAIESAMDKTGITPEARPQFKAVLEFMADKESGDNADAVNLHDTNAIGPTQVDGAPSQSSRGTWQTIPSTFAAHHAAGTSNNIYDPEASAGAAINYIKDKYEVGADGSGLERFAASRRSNGYTGY